MVRRYTVKQGTARRKMPSHGPFWNGRSIASQCLKSKTSQWACIDLDALGGSTGDDLRYRFFKDKAHKLSDGTRTIET